MARATARRSREVAEIRRITPYAANFHPGVRLGVVYNRAVRPNFYRFSNPAREAMADQPSKIRDIAWSELFPWLLLTRAVRISLLARVLVLGALGLVATGLGWRLLYEAFGPSSDPVVARWSNVSDLGIWEKMFRAGEVNPWVNTSARSAVEVFESATDSLVQAPISIWLYLTRPFIYLFDGDLKASGFLFLVVCIIWELLVWGLFGGAITRIAALKFTRDEVPGMFAALKHGFGKLPSYSLPPLIAMAGTAVFALQLVVLGIIMRVGVLAFLAAIAWPFVIVLGLMMAILLLGALFGWPLMWATVSVEGTDAFDALSRSYAYTYHRPWRFLWYVLFAGFLAMMSMFVVKLFASSAVALGNWSITWGLDQETMRSVVAPLPKNEAAQIVEPTAPPVDVAGASEKAKDATAPVASTMEPPPEQGKLLSASAAAIRFWKIVVAVLVAGYQVGFLWVSAVGIYLLLRHDIDGVQIAEVYVDQVAEYGVPPLVDDPATGVPSVAAQGAARPGDVRS
jgi:hypothetical protein